ncbi:ribonuclease HII [Thiorhodococcus minor]|uniref:Ribonuclease HII n=1 Tax=Thiorhodococcus minor TaxID=57489 RepID=A0A6M0JYM6_9GAMM|nr:ribonuclease HII [Thiorhodococcus minor]NEV61477.1 ribonuclease HII [Thiorhodococcus minor]
MLIAGVDEAGRGPLAGPVYASAVILGSARPLSGIDDSKRLTAARRERLDVETRASALAWSIATASVEEIDRLNILQASMLAMQRAVAALAVAPGLVLVDGNRCPPLEVASQAVVGGDGRVLEIGAASILAKVARDRAMLALDDACPGYGFAAHKGYPTAAHLAALTRLGPTSHHRKSFAPVRRVLEGRDPP